MESAKRYKDFVYEYDLENGGIRITKYMGFEKIVHIPKRIGNIRVVSLGSYVFAEIENAGIENVKASVAKNSHFTPCEVIITDNIKSIGYCAFYGCENIVNIDIPENVTEIGSSAFAFCKKLESVVLPKGINIINRSTFRNCINLKTVEILGNVETIGFIAFENCLSLNRVLLPDSIKSIEMRAFCNCRALRWLKLPNQKTVFGNGVFAESGLIEITIPKTEYISEAMFLNCKALESVTIHEELSEIKELAFAGCENLESITFPNSVKRIGKRAFMNCESLEHISPLSDETVLEDEALKNTPLT